jgi:hypothetical protein
MKIQIYVNHLQIPYSTPKSLVDDIVKLIETPGDVSSGGQSDTAEETGIDSSSIAIRNPNNNNSSSSSSSSSSLATNSNPNVPRNSRSNNQQRLVIETTADVNHQDDGYSWRKYGQKIVKGSNFPRSYYRCTEESCPVKKQVEQRDNAIINIYEGVHSHKAPNLTADGRKRRRKNNGNKIGERREEEETAALNALVQTSEMLNNAMLHVDDDVESNIKNEPNSSSSSQLLIDQSLHKTDMINHSSSSSHHY